MAWLWASFEEYGDYVQPVVADRPGLFKLCLRDTAAENQRRLLDAFRQLQDSLGALNKLGFSGSP